MSVPIREQILDKLATLLDASRAPTVQDFAAGSIIGLTDEEESAELFQDSTRIALTIRVEHLLRYDPVKISRATAANVALAELIQSLADAAADEDVAALLERIDYTTGGTLYPPEQSNIVGAYVQATVLYWTDTGNPYAYTALDQED